jgi:hypothetical protein
MCVGRRTGCCRYGCSCAYGAPEGNTCEVSLSPPPMGASWRQGRGRTSKQIPPTRSRADASMEACRSLTLPAEHICTGATCTAWSGVSGAIGHRGPSRGCRPCCGRSAADLRGKPRTACRAHGSVDGQPAQRLELAARAEASDVGGGPDGLLTAVGEYRGVPEAENCVTSVPSGSGLKSLIRGGSGDDRLSPRSPWDDGKRRPGRW